MKRLMETISIWLETIHFEKGDGIELETRSDKVKSMKVINHEPNQTRGAIRRIMWELRNEM